MSWSTSELRVRLAPLGRFRPSSGVFCWPFQGGASFVDLLCFCSGVCCVLCASVCVCFVVACWGGGGGGGWPLGSRLWCLLWVCCFPIGVLGRVWCLVVSIPDLCNLIYFYCIQSFSLLESWKKALKVPYKGAKKRLEGLVSWVRCGTWLYWFLIFAFFLTHMDLKKQLLFQAPQLDFCETLDKATCLQLVF